MHIDPRALRLLEDLRAARFAGLQGARVSLSLPIAERLLNDALTIAIPANAPVRKVSVRPLPNNQLAVTGSIVAAPFLPPLSLTFTIESQPVAPEWRLGLRTQALPGIFAMAGSMFKVDSMLPPGITLVGPRVAVDIRLLLEQRGLAEILDYVDGLRVRSEDGRLIVEADLAVKQQIP